MVYICSLDILCTYLQVESLTAARKSAMQGQEPSDAIRVVNALLTQIDHIKRYLIKSAMQGQEPSDAIRVVNALLTQIDHIKRYLYLKSAMEDQEP